MIENHKLLYYKEIKNLTYEKYCDFNVVLFFKKNSNL